MPVSLERFSLNFRPTSQMIHLNPSVKFGPVLPDGRQQRVQSSGPHWIMALTFQLTEVRELQEFRSFVTKMAGGATEVIVPVRDRRQAPWPTGYDYESSLLPVDWAASRVWSKAWSRRIIRINTYTGVSPGATEMEVIVRSSGTLYRGQMFSMTDVTGRVRLYQIAGVPGKPTTVSGSVVRRRITFQPPLRNTVRAETPLDFDNPAVTVTLDKPDAGQMTYEGWYKAAPTLTLRESFGS